MAPLQQQQQQQGQITIVLRILNIDIRESVQTPYGNRPVTNIIGETTEGRYQVTGWQANAIRLRQQQLVLGIAYQFVDLQERNTIRNGMQQLAFVTRSMVAFNRICFSQLFIF